MGVVWGHKLGLQGAVAGYEAIRCVGGFVRKCQKIGAVDFESVVVVVYVEVYTGITQA